MKLVNNSIKNNILRIIQAQIHCLISTKVLRPIMFPIRGQYWVRDPVHPGNRVLLQVLEPVQAKIK